LKFPALEKTKNQMLIATLELIPSPLNLFFFKLLFFTTFSRHMKEKKEKGIDGWMATRVCAVRDYANRSRPLLSCESSLLVRQLLLLLLLLYGLGCAHG
jgi:hypothetical protein